MGFASFITLVGAVTILLGLIKLLKLLSIYLLPSRMSRFAHTSSTGGTPWALVTGASDGIGRAFADELASQGFNVVLHGRNNEKLSLVVLRLQEKYPERSFRMLLADASRVPCLNCIDTQDTHSTEERDGIISFDVIREAVRDLHLTVLINNAGKGPSDPIYAPLSECSASRVINNISLNALFPFHLTRVLLPQLASNSPALVMNISSMTDDGWPLLASYSASKQFLLTMTRAVRLELALQGKSVDVELLGVRFGRVTGVSGLRARPPSLFTPDAATMARAALGRAGREYGLVIGYWGHALQQLAVWLLPGWLQDRLIISVIQRERDDELRGRKDE